MYMWVGVSVTGLIVCVCSLAYREQTTGQGYLLTIWSPKYLHWILGAVGWALSLAEEGRRGADQ